MRKTRNHEYTITIMPSSGVTWNLEPLEWSVVATSYGNAMHKVMRLALQRKWIKARPRTDRDSKGWRGVKVALKPQGGQQWQPTLLKFEKRVRPMAARKLAA